jgi:hypothetical protein
MLVERMPNPVPLYALVIVLAGALIFIAHHSSRAILASGSDREAPSQPAKRCPDIAQLANRASLPETSADNPALYHKTIVNVHDLKWDCDTTQFLRNLFSEVTKKGSSDIEKGMIWTSYLQDTISHTCSPPEDDEGWALYHPIALLENRLLHCSQVARLVVDGFIAAQIPARVLQMRGHQSAEFFADGRWILAEADILGRGQFLRNAAGEPVGIDEVKKDPSILDSVLPYEKVFPFCRGEFSANLEPKIETPWFSTFDGQKQFSVNEAIHLWRSVFDSVAYPEYSALETPYVIKKTASSEQLNHQTFGWNHWVYCSRSDPDCTN